MRSRLLVILVFSLFSVPGLCFQGGRTESTTTTKSEAIPGAGYGAGWLRCLLLGNNWRELWTTPVSAEVLDQIFFHAEPRHEFGRASLRAEAEHGHAHGRRRDQAVQAETDDNFARR